jgi:A/G-specific adenine glycosylase
MNTDKHRCIGRRSARRTNLCSSVFICGSLPDSAWLRSFRRRLLAWYDRHARKLPWRRNRDPYAVWLSEIMLQQTTVATVAGYFDRFLAVFPTIEALAAADQHDVLRLWEGLGYYRRARQLQQAANIIVAEHGGRFPSDPEIVRRLPGIGRYTAGAILSIAFDAREPILEANTLRLFSRLLGFDGDPRSTAGQQLLWRMAEAVLPKRGSGRLNQALMELGSQICTPKAPQCETCPVATLCRASQQGRQLEIPRPKAKRLIEAVRQAVVLVRRRGRVLLLRWSEGQRFAGLWDFPRFPVVSERPAELRREMADNILALTGVVAAPGRHVTTLTHGVTRFRITLECYEAEFLSNGKASNKNRVPLLRRSSAGRGPLPGTACNQAVAHSGQNCALETRWLRPAELDAYPLSSTGRKLARLVQAAG